MKLCLVMKHHFIKDMHKYSFFTECRNSSSVINASKSYSFAGRPDCEKCIDQTHSSPRDRRLSASWGMK